MTPDPLHLHYYDQFIAELSLSHRLDVVVMLGLCDVHQAAFVTDLLRGLVDQRLAGRLMQVSPNDVASAFADPAVGQAFAVATVNLPIDGVPRDEGQFFWANAFLYDFARVAMSAPEGIDPWRWMSFQAALRGQTCNERSIANVDACRAALVAYMPIAAMRKTVADWANEAVSDRDLAVAQLFDWQAGAGELYAMTRDALMVKAARALWKPFSNLFDPDEKDALLRHMRVEMHDGLADGLDGISDLIIDYRISRDQALNDMDRSTTLAHPDVLLRAS